MDCEIVTPKAVDFSMHDIRVEEARRWKQYELDTGETAPMQMPRCCHIPSTQELEESFQNSQMTLPDVACHVIKPARTVYQEIYMEGVDRMPPCVTHPMKVFGVDSCTMLVTGNVEYDESRKYTDPEMYEMAKDRYFWMHSRNCLFSASADQPAESGDETTLAAGCVSVDEIRGFL